MIRIEDKRGTGKTSRLLLIAKEHGQTIVVSTFRHQKYVKDKALQYFGKDHGIKIITAHEFWAPEFRSKPNETFLIDDLEWTLQSRHVVGYSMSVE